MPTPKTVVTVIPNGVRSGADDRMVLRFSILTGLATDSTEKTATFTAGQIRSSVGQTQQLLETAGNIKLHFGDLTTAINIPVLGLKDKTQPLWDRLLGNREFHAETNGSLKGIFDGPVTSFYQKDIYGSEAGSTDYHPLKVLDSVLTKKNIDTTNRKRLEEALTEVKEATRKQVLLSERRYELAYRFAEKKSGELEVRGEKTSLNVQDLYAQLFQHPEKAREYGLIVDFEVDDPRFINAYFKMQGGERLNMHTGSLHLSGPDPEVFILEKTDVMTAVLSDGNLKYYHGLPDFGLLGLDRYEFRTADRDMMLQRDHDTAERLYTIVRENKAHAQFSDILATPVKGIFLHRVDDNTSLVKPHTLGLHVSVRKSRGQAPKQWESLCSREVIYRTPGIPEQRYEQEGWIQPESLTAAGNVSIASQSIFQWKGFNLCVPTSKASRDPQAIQSDEMKKGGFEGINENRELDHFAETAFGFEYRALPQSNIFLEDGHDYSFLLTYVQSNGKKLAANPDPSNPVEISFADLSSLPADWIKKRIYNFGRFSMDQEPISAPVLLPGKRANDQKQNSPQVLLLKDRNKTEKKLFPPLLEIQQAFFFGLFSPGNLNAKEQNYPREALTLLKRGRNTIPSEEGNGPVGYLADVRGRYIQVTPADWYTRQFFQAETDGLPYFEYNQKGNYYTHTRPGKILVHDSEDICRIRKTGREIHFHVKAGYAFKFHLKLQEGPGADKSLKEAFNLQKINGLFLQESYSKGAPLEITVINGRPKPPKPEVKGGYLEAWRPFNGNLSNHLVIFFELKNDSPELTKRYQIISEYTIVEDDGQNIPPDKILQAERKIWERKNPSSELLTDEFPATIFNNHYRNMVHKEVYRNNFGFDLKLTAATCERLSPGDTILTLKFNEKIPVSVIYKGNNRGRVAYGSATIGNELDLTQENIVRIKYATPRSTLQMSVLLNGEEIGSFDDLNLPHTDLNARHLELLTKLEQSLLQENAGLSHGRFIHEGNDFRHFFALYNETATTSFDGQVKIQAIGAFSDLFKEKTLEEQSSYSDDIPLSVQNGRIPEPPEFTVSTLIFKESDRHSKIRSSQLLFEIERPLRHEEEFAIILAAEPDGSPAGSELTASTSAVGRDITSFQEDIPYRKGDQAITLREFITVNSPSKPYLLKYVEDGLGGQNTGSTEDHKVYHLLPLKPFFHTKKNKWMAILDLSENGLINNYYNPFVKIVAATNRPNSFPLRQLSRFTAPKYISLLSPRKVSFKKMQLEVKVNGSPKNIPVLRISVDNFSVKKYAADGEPRTLFIACCREKSPSGISGKITDIAQIQYGQLMDRQSYNRFYGDGLIDLEYRNNTTVAVYEYEAFANSADGDVEWQNEPSLRLIYMEEITL